MTPITHRYEHDADRLLALLTDEAFLIERCLAMGERNVSVDVTQSGSVKRVTCARDVERDLPSFAKKLFKPTNRIVQVEEWDTAARTGTYEVKVEGAPVTIKARMSITPHPSGCELAITHQVEVRVPLIGGRLEKYVLEQIKSGAARELAYNAEHLRRSSGA